MNSDPQPTPVSAPMPMSMPPFKTLHWVDATIRNSTKVVFAGVLMVGGFWFMSRPMPNAVPVPLEEMPPEIRYAPWIMAAGSALMVVGGILLTLRYLKVKKILTHGTIIKGFVEVAEKWDTNHHSSSSTSTMSTTPTYAYYVTIRYEMLGKERKMRMKLPHTYSYYGMKQGGDVELLTLEGASGKPLIRTLYVEPKRIGKKKFFW